jgi:cytoskeletal protein CcmA (bactofilin family)
MKWKRNRPYMAKQKEVTLIAADAELVGEIAFAGQLIVNGVLRGATTAEAPGAAMTISSGGHVVGDIRVPSILIHGRVEGTVYSTENLEIAEGASIQGDLNYNVLQMHMGATVQGRLIHLVPEKAAQTAENELTAKSSISE